ncbi:MAG: hypothetical protein ABJF10_13580 [Chthoniobacter sp.]|uniref:hypothetical protein n=1 Tax=Chthoniobacter sp. TaxID=2510640 RepID=UPI0032AC3DF8
MTTATTPLWLTCSDKHHPLLITNDALLNSGLLCPGCRRTGSRLNLTCSTKCDRQFKPLLDGAGRHLTEVGIRFGSLWANEQGTHIALTPNVRSRHTFILTAPNGNTGDLTDALKCSIIASSGSTAVEAYLDRLAVQGIMVRAEKDLFMPLLIVFREFLRDAGLRLSEVELLMPNPNNFLPELALFQKRIRKIAAKAFHPDKHKGSVEFVHYLTSEFWNTLLKPTEIALGGRMRGHEILMAYPGLDLSEPSPIAWRYSKFVGWTPPDETALRRIVAEWRQRATNNLPPSTSNSSRP